MNQTMMTEDQLFNGWTNYETWNVSLWMQNEFVLYREALCVAMDGGFYEDFVHLMEEMGCDSTPDGVQWGDPKVDADALSEMMTEMIEGV